MSSTAAAPASFNQNSPRVRKQLTVGSASDIAEHARRPATRRRLIDALELIDNDECDLGRISRFKQTLLDGAAHAALLDNATIAHAAAKLLQPRRALEIGVRRGFAS